MRISPLRLDEFGLEELVLEATPFLPQKPPADEEYVFKEIDFELEKHTEKEIFRIRLVIELLSNPDAEEQTALRRLRMVLWGVFSFAEGTAQELIDKLTPLNQVAILYGMARGLIAGLPSTARTGTFLLPSVNFVEVLKRKAEQQKKSTKRIAATRKEKQTKKTTKKRTTKKSRAKKKG